MCLLRPLGSLTSAAQDVFASRHLFKMVRIDAQWVSAKMIKHQRRI